MVEQRSRRFQRQNKAWVDFLKVLGNSGSSGSLRAVDPENQRSQLELTLNTSGLQPIVRVATTAAELPSTAAIEFGYVPSYSAVPT